ncbi:MAG: hypothetical protein JNK58_01315 [Phycisphaerae bacterium]|nr:hypothetical protein [Phycisphaerae bacterium]
MTLNPLDLLRQLGSGVRPAAAEKPATPIDQAGFAELLSKVQAGGIASNEPVQVAPGQRIELSTEQLQRLGVAIDAAEAAGHHRVLALIDGQALTIDVPGRMVMESHSAADARLLTDFDAVISVPNTGTKDLRALFSRADRPHANPSPLAALGTIRNRSLSDIVN